MALAVGTKAPAFNLVSQDNERVSLSDYAGRNLVIAFFPAVFSGVCDTEMCTFRDMSDQFNSVDADVVGISVDGRWSNNEFATKLNLGFPILSDYSRDTISAYDVVFPNFGGLEGYDAAVRSVFVVDKTGNIRWTWTAPQPGLEPDYDEVQRAVNSLS